MCFTMGGDLRYVNMGKRIMRVPLSHSGGTVSAFWLLWILRWRRLRHFPLSTVDNMSGLGLWRECGPKSDPGRRKE